MKAKPDVFFEVPFEALMYKGSLRLSDPQAFEKWVLSELDENDLALIYVVPVRPTGYHSAAHRYWRNCALPLIADALGESNLDVAHDIVAAMFLPLVPDGKGGLVRKSTAMDSMGCAEFCDFLDRAIAWACHADHLNLRIPLANRRWRRDEMMNY